MLVFVCCTVKFFYTAGVSEHKRSGWRRVVCTHKLLMLFGQELTIIPSENKKIMACEMDHESHQTRLGAFKCQTPYCYIKGK